MADFIGAGGDARVSFTLSNGQSIRIWWFGFGEGGVGDHIGFPWGGMFATVFSRVVVDNNAMEYRDGAGPSGLVYTTDLHAEPGSSGASLAAFRLLVGQVK